MQKRENNIIADFRWVFTADAEPDEDDQKYKTFLKQMFQSSTNSFLLLKKDEEDFLKIYK